MKLRTLDTLIWTLVYGGLLLVALGLAVERRDDALGWAIVAGGVVIAVGGVVLLAVRARLPDDPH